MRRLPLLCALAALIAGPGLPDLPARAATPAAGSLSAAHPTARWQGRHYASGNTRDAFDSLGENISCQDPSADCDHFAVTVSVTRPTYVTATIRWPSASNEFDLFVQDPSGATVANAQNVGTSSQSVEFLAHNGTYDLAVVPFTVTDSGYTGSVTLLPPTLASLGGTVTFRATPVPGPNPAREPANDAVPSRTELVLGSSRIGHRAIEPTLGVTPRGAVFFGASAYDTAGVVPHNQVYRSDDVGRTWRNVSPTVAGADSHPANNDSYLYVDPDYGRIFTMDTTSAGGSELSYSDDGGRTWSDSMAYAAGVNDHMTIVAGRVPAGSGLVTLDPAFPKILYYCVNTLEATTCGRSLDGGRTWLPGGNAFVDPNGVCGALTGHLAAGPDGRVYLASAFDNNVLCPPHPLTVASSYDGGTTWTASPVSTSIFDAEHDGSLAVDSAGNVYVGWEDDRRRLPYLSVSRDHGASWGTPLMIAPPGVRHARFSNITAGGPGRIAVDFIGTPTADQADPTRPWALHVMVSTDALSPRPTFHAAVAAVPGAAYPVVHRGACVAQCPGLFDFLDLQHDPRPDGAVWASLSDNCTGRCASNPAGASDDQLAGQGIAVYQVAGPRLSPATGRRGEPRDHSAGQPQEPVPGPGLPATGGGSGAALCGVVLLVLLGLLRRRPAAP